MIAYTDGGTKGNGTKDAKSYGSYKIENQPIIRLILNTVTNNRSEYKTLQILLEDLINQNLKEVEIFTDSQLMVNQISNNWHIKNFELLEYVVKCRELLKQCESKLTWCNRSIIEQILGH